jgi:flagellar basal-body rod protein FlgB
MRIDGLFNSTIDLLGKSIDLRIKNHTHIAGNLANAETPGYTPTVLEFEKQLKNAFEKNDGPSPAVTNPRHIPLGGNQVLQNVEGDVLEVPAPAEGRDGNGVELEREMGRMAENQIMYNASIQILQKKFEALKYAIKGN